MNVNCHHLHKNLGQLPCKGVLSDSLERTGNHLLQQKCCAHCYISIYFRYISFQLIILFQGFHPKNSEAATEDAPLNTDATNVEPLTTETRTATDVITTTTADVIDSTPSVSAEDKVEDNYLQDDDDKPVKFGKIVDPHVLGCCEFCGGPVKRRRFCSPLKRFCSKGCSRSSRKANLKVCDPKCLLKW